MFRRLGWLTGQNSIKRLSNADPPTASLCKIKPVLMFEILQEVAVYIHRFHNLDLFQQGWYQLKISMRWEDEQYSGVGTPARVIQYEGADIHGVWRIDDEDNSFYTQPFRIKYARQDVRLAIMVSFSISLSRNNAPSTSAVILKFELLQAPITENEVEFMASFDASSVAVHEFRIPPKALLGVHSYCPVHFDVFHAVLVDVSVHVSLLKAGSYKKVLREACGGGNDGFNQSLDQSSVDSKQISLIKALIVARNTLVEELKNISKAIDRAVDLAIYTSEMDEIKMFDLQYNSVTADGEVPVQGKPENGLERENSIVDIQADELVHKFPKASITNVLDSLGAQLSYLWATFLQFHRENKTDILKFLRDAWARDRKAEWSIWMVYSTVEVPQNSNGEDDDSSAHGVHRRTSTSLKNDDPAQSAATRAELHRRSIAQMRINNRSIQDLQIFGDPLRIPIIIVERVLNAPKRTFSNNSYFRNMDMASPRSLLARPGTEAGDKPHSLIPQPKGRVLKIVVFVHGFQGHHLDLRLVRNQWLLIDPKVDFLMSEANEDKTSGDLREMGHRLAQEVISFVKKKMDKISRSGGLQVVKLSFVGHSIGNVIIRTALADGIMEPYLTYLHSYLSISGPHLGYLYSSNSLFNSGMWLLKKLRGTQCIHQLTYTDDPDLRNTFFYKLCAQKTLDNFKNLILLSSPQDGYIPYHSARIEACQAASLDYTKKGQVFHEMLNNCLDQIRSPATEQRLFMRCDVNFDASAYGRNFNSFIGRAAHIEFLESDSFAKFIMWSFPELFH